MGLNKSAILENIVEGLDEILDQIPSLKIFVTKLDGEKVQVKLCSLRLQNFKEHGTVCDLCNVQATHWVLTNNSGDQGFHLNLMAGDILMTQDHVIPRALGGPNHISNLRTLCGPCNWKLGDKLGEEMLAKIEPTLPPIKISFVNSDEKHWKFSRFRKTLFTSESYAEVVQKAKKFLEENSNLSKSIVYPKQLEEILKNNP